MNSADEFIKEFVEREFNDFLRNMELYLEWRANPPKQTEFALIVNQEPCDFTSVCASSSGEQTPRPQS